MIIFSMIGMKKMIPINGMDLTIRVLPKKKLSKTFKLTI